jgi:hypothetical protein
MRTGERTDALPDLRKESHVSYTWTEYYPPQQSVTPLYERRAGEGDADFFAGLSIAGRVVPIDLGLKKVHYLAQARAGDGYAAFRLRRDGTAKETPSPLWLLPLQEPRQVEEIAGDITDFAVLGRGNVVYVKGSAGRSVLSDYHHQAEALFRAREERSTWNVLDGVKRLPALDKALAGKTYIMDRMGVKLVEGFGSSRHDALVLCQFEHYRGDRRAFTIGMERSLETVTWRRTVLVTHDGRRYLMPPRPEGDVLDRYWLHNSGKLLIGTDDREDTPEGQRLHLRLILRTIELR